MSGSAGERARRRVAVSGLGVVGPFGLGAAPLAAALAAGGPLPLVEVDRSAGFHRARGATRALAATHLELGPLLPPSSGRRMSPPARFAVAAARLALEDAGLADSDLSATAVISGTAWGPTSVTEQLLRQILETGPETASPALFTESVASAAASQVALAFRARGPNIAINQREASDLLAIGEAMRQVASGRAERALVVIVDEMIPLLHAILDQYGALARADAAGEERPRPFDRRRSGLLAAEGATALVLEPVEAIGLRAGRARLEIVAAGAAFDPTAPPFDYGSGGARLAARLARELARRGVGLERIGHLISGAAGTQRGDRLEAELLRALFAGRPLPALQAPKRITGEYGGGFAAAALLVAEGSALAPPPEFEPDPELGVRPTSEPVPETGGSALVTAAAAGGAAAWIVIAPPRAGEPSTDPDV